VILDSTIYHLPNPIIFQEPSFYLPLQPFLKCFSGYFPATLEFNRGELNYYPKEYNIFHIQTSSLENKRIYNILTSEKLYFTGEILTPYQLLLIMPKGKADENLWSQKKLPPGLDSLVFQKTVEGLRMELYFESNVILDSVYTVDNPVGIRIETTIIIPQTEEINLNLTQAKDKWRFDTIVIDPGHGGKDPGAIGLYGLKEKEVVLDIALRLEKLFKAKTKIKTILTRRSDTFIPLNERGKIANQAEGKLFVSLHCNAAKDRKIQGFQIFFLKPARNKEALEVAMLENAAIKYEENQLQYQELTDENYILLAMTQSNYVKESETLCARIQDKFAQKTKLKNLGVDQAGFYVLYGANMPAVLVESAFISNRYEEKLLRSKSFRQTLAQAIFESLVKFCQEKEKEI
jgi:N-acetylmuramoyl-L-alanine amidase